MRDWRPPAVTTEFFDLVCPHPTIVHVGDTKSALAEATASTIFNASRLQNKTVLITGASGGIGQVCL